MTDEYIVYFLLSTFYHFIGRYFVFAVELRAGFLWGFLLNYFWVGFIILGTFVSQLYCHNNRNVNWIRVFHVMAKQEVQVHVILIVVPLVHEHSTM